MTTNHPVYQLTLFLEMRLKTFWPEELGKQMEGIYHRVYDHSGPKDDTFWQEIYSECVKIGNDALCELSRVKNEIEIQSSAAKLPSTPSSVGISSNPLSTVQADLNSVKNSIQEMNSFWQGHLVQQQSKLSDRLIPAVKDWKTRQSAKGKNIFVEPDDHYWNELIRHFESLLHYWKKDIQKKLNSQLRRDTGFHLKEINIFCKSHKLPPLYFSSLEEISIPNIFIPDKPFSEITHPSVYSLFFRTLRSQMISLGIFAGLAATIFISSFGLNSSFARALIMLIALPFIGFGAFLWTKYQKKEYVQQKLKNSIKNQKTEIARHFDKSFNQYRGSLDLRIKNYLKNIKKTVDQWEYHTCKKLFALQEYSDLRANTSCDSSVLFSLNDTIKTINDNILPVLQHHSSKERD